VGQAARYASPGRKWWVCLSSLVQTTLLLVCAIVLTVVRNCELVASGQPVQVAIVVLMRVAGTAQIVMTRTLDREITTALITGPTLDVLSDPNFFPFLRHPTQYPAMCKRSLIILSVFVGAFVSVLVQSFIGPEKLLMVSSSLRIVIVIALALAPTENRVEEVEKLPLAAQAC